MPEHDRHSRPDLGGERLRSPILWNSGRVGGCQLRHVGGWRRVYYYDPPYYFETADAWASFSQQATITGRPTGTPGFYRLYGIQVLGPSVGPGWGLEDLAPWVPFTFGVPFEIRGDLHLYRSEGFEVNNLVMYGMEVFDVNKNLLWTFGDRNYWEDRDHIFVQQSPEAVYAIPTPEPASIALILPALVLLYAYRERLKQHV